MVLAYVSVHLSGGGGQLPSQCIGSVWVLVSAMKRREESNRAGEFFQMLSRGKEEVQRQGMLWASGERGAQGMLWTEITRGCEGTGVTF